MLWGSNRYPERQFTRLAIGYQTVRHVATEKFNKRQTEAASDEDMIGRIINRIQTGKKQRELSDHSVSREFAGAVASEPLYSLHLKRRCMTKWKPGLQLIASKCA